MSLVNQKPLLNKVYFPRLFVPSAAVGSASFDMLISMPLRFAVLVIYKVPFTLNLLLLPLLIVLTLMLGLGMAYLLSALIVTSPDCIEADRSHLSPRTAQLLRQPLTSADMARWFWS